MGTPLVKLVANGLGESKGDIAEGKRAESACVISRVGDRYYWKSRDNNEVVKITLDNYTVFKRIDYPEYVKIASPRMEEQVLRLGTAALAEYSLLNLTTYDYVEHVGHHLYTITYWGAVVHADPSLWVR